MSIYKVEHWPRAKNPNLNIGRQLYEIVRFYRDSARPARVRRKLGRMSETDAQRHCSREDTRGADWFEGYRRVGA